MCLEYDKLKNKYSCSELRHEALIEKIKWELFRVMLKQKEEDYLGVEHMMEKIDEECELELTTEICEEEYGNELECDKRTMKRLK